MRFRWVLALALTALAGRVVDHLPAGLIPRWECGLVLLSWAILGVSGLGSIPGLLISGIIVGCVESLTTAYWDPRARSITVYMIFIIILWLKPKGLFGKK